MEPSQVVCLGPCWTPSLPHGTQQAANGALAIQHPASQMPALEKQLQRIHQEGGASSGLYSDK